MSTNVLMCLNTLIAKRLCKGQYGAVFQQGICVKMKIPSGTQEREFSERIQPKQAGRGEDG